MEHNIQGDSSYRFDSYAPSMQQQSKMSQQYYEENSRHWIQPRMYPKVYVASSNHLIGGGNNHMITQRANQQAPKDESNYASYASVTSPNHYVIKSSSKYQSSYQQPCSQIYRDVSNNCVVMSNSNNINGNNPQQYFLEEEQEWEASTRFDNYVGPVRSSGQPKSSRRRRHSSGEEESMGVTTTNTTDFVFKTDFSSVLHRSPPPMPPALLRKLSSKEVATSCGGVGKVKVMLRVLSNSSVDGSSFLCLDKRKKLVTLYDPSSLGSKSISSTNVLPSDGSANTSAPEDRRVGVAAPKMFAFDALFSSDDSQTEVCSSALTDVIHAVINGNDGCLFSFGHAKLGKTHTMIGSSDATNSVGISPSAIAWLFRAVQEQKQRSGARFSVRVSAVEVSSGGGPGLVENVKDLLAAFASDCDPTPGVYLRNDPLLGSHLQNQTELRAPSLEKAAFYLDAALDNRGSSSNHFLFTLHVYHYCVDKSGKGGVAGGRSRLHLLDLGSYERGPKGGHGMSVSALGNVIIALCNGQKHLPYRDSKITQLLRDCLNSLTCQAAMIAHVGTSTSVYTETLATIQLAARVHRIRRRRLKFGATNGSPGSGGSSGEESRLAALISGSDVDPSSSEQSCDTVIYVGPSSSSAHDQDATDGEHPPVYIPSMSSGDNRCAMNKVLRGSTGERGKPRVEQIMSNRPLPPIPKASTNTKIPSATTNTRSNNMSKPVPASPLRSKTGNKAPLVSQSKGSDEQWVDGPRVSKSRVAEVRTLLHKTGSKSETWVDGPQAASKIIAVGSYGFMDEHKKSMIKKWVESQSEHLEKQLTQTTPQEPHYKELTMFKTCEDDEEVPVVVEKSEEQLEVSSNKGETPIVEDLVLEKIGPEIQHFSEVPIDVKIKPKAGPTLEELYSQCEELVESLSLAAQHDLCEDDQNEISFQQAEIIHQKNHVNFEPSDDMEIIEVEEPEEPVPTADSCLQVTEEDIALCLSLVEDPLPEVDQQERRKQQQRLATIGCDKDESGFMYNETQMSLMEHPLRVLSEENLTVVSTFADTLSITSDPERSMGRLRDLEEVDDHHSQFYHTVYNTPRYPVDFKLHPQKRQLQSDEQCNIISGSKICSNCRNVIDPNDSQPKNKHGYLPPPKLESDWFLEDNQGETELLQCLQQCQWANRRLSFHYITNVDTKESVLGVNPEKLAALRHPDGASNPNLEESAYLRDNVRALPLGKSDDESDTVPKSVSKPAKINRLFNSSGHGRKSSSSSSSSSSKDSFTGVGKNFGMKSLPSRCRRTDNILPPTPECYDSGNDSSAAMHKTLQHPKPGKGCFSPLAISSSGSKSKPSLLPGESSGYESVVRDSECSSFGSSQESDGEAIFTNIIPSNSITSLKNPKPLPQPPQLIQYGPDDVARLERRWQHRLARIRQLRQIQEELKKELARAKARLLIQPDRWSYELHVEGSMDPRDPSFVEVLERETHILQKRVDACKSHILVATCFDCIPRRLEQ